jgi:hypothetical protein
VPAINGWNMIAQAGIPGENVVEAIFAFHVHAMVAAVGTLLGIIGIAFGVIGKKNLKSASLWGE